MYFLGKHYGKKSDVDRLERSITEIQINLEALGFTARVAEANVHKGFDEFYLEIALGTEINKLEKHGRELALALKSPTGKVHWQIPVPGTNYIGLRLPRSSNGINHEELMRLKIRDWRSKLASVFYWIGEASFATARKVLGY